MRAVERWSACRRTNVLAAVAAKCLTSEGHGGRTYQLCGPELLKSSDLAAILGQVYKREVNAIAPTPADVAEKLRSFGMSEQMVEHAGKLGAFNRTGALGHLSGDIQELLDRAPTSFRRFVEDTSVD
jgi:uncharacterized protein YbjT (DUF2867 family)